MQSNDSDYEDRIKVLGSMIENLKRDHPSLSYIECTVAICEKLKIELETTKRVIPKSIKEKIEAEALKMNLLKYKINTLV